MVLVSGGATPSEQLIGMITGATPPPAVFAWFLADATRFPKVAGYWVNAPAPYSIRLEGVDSRGAPVSTIWGPQTLAGGAQIDVTLTL